MPPAETASLVERQSTPPSEVHTENSLSTVRQETFGASNQNKINDKPGEQAGDQPTGLLNIDTTGGSQGKASDSPEVRAMLDGFVIDEGTGLNHEAVGAGSETAASNKGAAPRMTEIQLASVGGVPEAPGEPTPAPRPPREGDPAELEKFDSPFTEKFDREKADRLVENFRSDEFSVRQSAQNELQKMGPEAIPFMENKIEQEANGGKDPELMLRGKVAIDFIQSAQRQIEFNQLLQSANKLVPELQKLYAAGGADMDSQGMSAADPMGNETRFGPQLVVGAPPNKPIGAAQEKAFNKLISDLDTASSNPLLNEKLKELEPAFTAGQIQDKHGKDQYFRMAWLQRGSNEAREYLAKGLAESKDPGQQARARDLIAESLERGRKPTSDLRSTALKAGGQNDAEFQKNWKKHGGADLTDSVLKKRSD